MTSSSEDAARNSASRDTARGERKPLPFQSAVDSPNEKFHGDETWIALCAQAAVEQDPKRLLELVSEINRLLHIRKKRLASDSEGNS